MIVISYPFTEEETVEMDDRDDNEEDEEEDMNGEKDDLVTSVMDQETKEHRIQVRRG